ncbi:MAG: riboflavin synthase [Clostridiales bacterium]|nr:riboflavin synthase [Clostridiales bacterium]
MFTGIIEETGVVQRIVKGARSAVLSIQGEQIFDDLRLGDSVAVNGVCLTVAGLAGGAFTADVMFETLNRSALGSLNIGGRVNLERAMPANGRFGGHIVSGHIDGTGVIAALRRDDNALLHTIRAPENIMKYVVEKGSIAIDGISLTVAGLFSDSFTVSLIPHTAKNTTLAEKSVGDTVNLENDIIGKYVERLMQYGPAAAKRSSLTAERLLELGF